MYAIQETSARIGAVLTCVATSLAVYACTKMITGLLPTGTATETRTARAANYRSGLRALISSSVPRFLDSRA